MDSAIILRRLLPLMTVDTEHGEHRVRLFVLVRFVVLSVGLISLLSSGRLVRAAELVLVAEGKSEYQIVVPDALPTPALDESLRQTARLMQAAFQANGCEVAVVAEAKRDPSRPGIFLGDTAYARACGIDPSKLMGWGYVQKAVGQDVIIAGRDQPAPAKPIQERRPTWDRVGTAKGVVDFLRQFVGTRFLYPDLGPYQPIGAAARIDLLNSPAFEFLKPPKIVVPDDLNVAKTPLLEFNTAHPPRGSFYDIANNRFPLVDSIFGGHTYERAIPREKYADSHPEYFALIGGERTAKGIGNAQYCISNLDVQELFFQDLIDLIDRGFDGVDLGQPDGFRACQCENCAKLFGTGSDWGEKLWILHRNLAARVEQARPGRQVTMMSYIQTELPPKTFKVFPSNTRILLTGTNDEDIAPWRGHEVPAGYSSYIYNWCPNLGTRYTPMRTPLFVESQAKRLSRNKFQSIYRDGPGDLFGLEGPVYYTMGRMFDDPDNLQARQLVQEFCGAAFGRSAPSMLAFYDQLYHGIELYANHLGTRDPAWTYQDIHGRRRKHLTDPLQFLGFLYSPNLLQALERDLAAAEKLADTEKVKQRLALVRREFDYLKALIKVVHLYHAFQIQPDMASRNRLLDAIASRNAYIDSLFAAPRNGPTPLDGFSLVPFPQLGHDAKHLRLAYDGYQEPFANSVMNWDTKVMRNAPLPGAQRLAVKSVSDSITADAPLWQQVAEAELSVLRSGEETVATQSEVSAVTVRMLSNESHLFVRVEAAAPTSDSRDSIDVLLAPLDGKDITYRFTVGPQMDSKQDAANGFNSDPLDPRFGKFDPDWNGQWQYESRSDAKAGRWTALLTIPFTTLGVERPKAGSFWRGNISHTRSAPARTARALWSASSSTKTLDDRNDFGELVFEAPQAGVATSDFDATLGRMRALHRDRKWKELIEQFGTDDFSAWPADVQDKASEAFHLRGQIYSFMKDGLKAEADLKAALKLVPKNQAFRLTLADNYTNNLQDDEQALAAYRQAFAISGKGNGWQPLTATIAIARLLTDQVKTDEALAVLKQYGDMEGMAPVWKIKMLRAYGHVYAARGNEKESLAKFREALELESNQ